MARLVRAFFTTNRRKKTRTEPGLFVVNVAALLALASGLQQGIA